MILLPSKRPKGSCFAEMHRSCKRLSRPVIAIPQELSMHAVTGLTEALKWVLGRLLGSKTLVSNLRLEEGGNA